MRIIITGGTGFIGRELVRQLQLKGHEVVVPSRSPARAGEVLGQSVLCPLWNAVDWEPLAKLMDEARESVAVVNLAGAGIADGRWTAKRKEIIVKSRISCTQAVARAIEEAAQKPLVLLQGSAVGYYGATASVQGKEITESSPVGNDFLACTAKNWEDGSNTVEKYGVRRVIVRTGIVLGPGGGVLKKMLPPFQFFMGGPLGSGKQYLPWIDLQDEVGAMLWLLHNKKAGGVYNLCAPTPVTMQEFCQVLAKTLGRPSWLPAPAFLLHLALGRAMAEETVLASLRVQPHRLLEDGYSFQYPDLNASLRDILS